MARKIVTCQESRQEVQASGCHCGAAAQYEQALKQGLIVLSDTDTVPGLHAWFDADGAMNRLCAFKERPREQFIYLFPDLPSVEALADLEAVSVRGLGRLLDSLRAPMTLVFPSHDEDGETTVAVRIVTHPFLRAVLRSCNPVASSSANKHGAPPPESLREVASAAREAADVEVRTQLPSAGIPSAVVDFSVRPVTVRRPGQLNEPELRSALRAFEVLR
jgi:tRNA A37 threonylcarbamoyladenosine synthetase subunit TsaC/SUA5/YrdC